MLYGHCARGGGVSRAEKGLGNHMYIHVRVRVRSNECTVYSRRLSYFYIQIRYSVEENSGVSRSLRNLYKVNGSVAFVRTSKVFCEQSD